MSVGNKADGNASANKVGNGESSNKCCDLHSLEAAIQMLMRFCLQTPETETRLVTVSFPSHTPPLPTPRKLTHSLILLQTNTILLTDNETGSNNGNNSANGGNDNGNGNASGNNLQGLGNLNLPDFNLIKIEESNDREEASKEKAGEKYQ